MDKFESHDSRTKWDLRFLRRAWEVSHWSKDPSTKVGCVFVDQNRIELAGGYNGFPRGVRDDERLQERSQKYPRIVHAEANAIASAARTGHALGSGFTAYCTFFPCATCAGLMIQAGLQRLVYVCRPEAEERWQEMLRPARDMLLETGIVITPYGEEALNGGG